MTTRADVATDDWDRLVQLPRWVVVAASASQRDLPYRTNTELEAGFLAAARGRQAANAFAAEVAQETMRVFDHPTPDDPSARPDPDAAIEATLVRARTVGEVLAGRVDSADAAAYRQWILAIVDVVISAARTGDFLGYGGKVVTESEQAYRDQLAAALGGPA